MSVPELRPTDTPACEPSLPPSLFLPRLFFLSFLVHLARRVKRKAPGTLPEPLLLLPRASAPAAMGLTISSLFSRLFGKKQMRILMGERGRAAGGGQGLVGVGVRGRREAGLSRSLCLLFCLFFLPPTLSTGRGGGGEAGPGSERMVERGEWGTMEA